ncbi:MAG: hypothetical protein ACE5IH_03430 [Thermodesulfobacteriota bacterium]
MAIILSIMLVLIAGCSTPYQKDSLSPFSSSLSDLAPADVLSLITERNKNLKVLKGEGVFSLRYQGREFKGKGIVWARRDSFRLDIFDPFFQPVYAITYNEGIVSVLSLKEKRVYRGVGLYNPLLPLPVDPSLFISFLFGELPSALFMEDAFSSGGVTKGGMDRGIYLLEVLSKDGLRYKIWLQSGEKVMIEGKAYNDRGELSASIKVERIDNINGISFPRRITAEYGDGVVMSVAYRTIFLNEDIEDDAFRLPLSSGIEEVDGSF